MASQSAKINILRQDHMDGAICILSIFEDLYKMSGLEMPAEVRDYPNLEGLKESLKLWYASPQIDIVRKFSIVTDVMQNKDALFLVGHNHVRVRAAQGIRYVDAIFAPEYCVRGDGKSKAKLTIKEAVDAMIEGIKSAERKYPWDVEVNLVAAIDRSNTPERAVELVNIFADCDRDYMPAIDLVCDEPGHPPEKHILAYRRAKEVGLIRACHAAEWVKNRPDEEKTTPEQIHRNFVTDLPARLRNLRTALYELDANFIHHGLGLCFDKELMRFMSERQIGVSVCPGNYIPSKLIPNVSTIKILTLIEAGVPVTLDVDDDLMFEGIEGVVKMSNLTSQEVEQLNRNAWLTRFGHRKEH